MVDQTHMRSAVGWRERDLYRARSGLQRLIRTLPTAREDDARGGNDFHEGAAGEGELVDVHRIAAPRPWVEPRAHTHPARIQLRLGEEGEDRLRLRGDGDLADDRVDLTNGHGVALCVAVGLRRRLSVGLTLRPRSRGTAPEAPPDPRGERGTGGVYRSAARR